VLAAIFPLTALNKSVKPDIGINKGGRWRVIAHASHPVLGDENHAQRQAFPAIDQYSCDDGFGFLLAQELPARDP
jgi:hypothetical protein